MEILSPHFPSFNDFLNFFIQSASDRFLFFKIGTVLHAMSSTY